MVRLGWIFLLVIYLSKIGLNRSQMMETWCPNVKCSNHTCDLKFLFVVVANRDVRDKLLTSIQQMTYGLDQKYEFRLQHDTNIFHLAETYSKILMIQKKSLPAFVHQEFNMSSLRSSLNKLFVLTSPESPSNSLMRIYLINSTRMEIKRFDQIQKIFPCSRSLLFADPISATMNLYLTRFFPQSIVLKKKELMSDLSQKWLESWLS
jgi:hypothetical protein